MTESLTDVAVIIPAHRVDRWLDEAIDSALASTDIAVQIVVVVNGTPTLPDRPWMHESAVTVLHSSEALGPTVAMIRGIEATSTVYIARLDADDRMQPDRLHRQREWLARHPESTLVGTATRRIGPDGEDLGAIRMPTGPDIRRHLVLSNTVVHSSVMMRRSDLESVGGYDARLSQMEDYHLILRLAQCGAVAVLPDDLTEYRLHPGQISRGAAPSGDHIDAVVSERSRLGRTLGMNTVGVWSRNTLWRIVQFARYHRLIRAGHEY